MDLTWIQFMEMKKKLSNQRGQTVVEYILLLVVSVSLFMTFYRSETFKRLFGEQGKIGLKMKTQNEFSYRHAFYGSGPDRATLSDIPRDNKDISLHPSYAEPGVGTRFFGPKDQYGQ
jgi:hypothetical protein